jgi:hypothetical protein
VAVQQPPTEAKSIPEVATELWDLTVTYARQETVDPIKGVGRFLAYGVSGSVALGAGAIMIGISALRALQTQTGSTFTGNLSWIPYLIVVVGGAAVIALAVSRISTRKGTGA